MTDLDPEPQPPPAPSQTNAPRVPTLEERFERFGREAERTGERIGREAEDYGRRLAANPAVNDATDAVARVWGLILIAVGAWFFAELTLGYDLPAIPWRDLWPVGLIAIGLVVIVRGMRRRSA